MTAIRQQSAEWLTARQQGVTATDAAIIAGETGSVVELWAQKLGLVDPPTFDDDTRQLMDDGLALQPYLLDIYRRRTGRKVRAVNTLRRSKSWALAMASPDGEVVGEPIGIEAKMTVSPRWPQAMSAGDPVPGDVLAQVQWQAYVCGWDAIHVVVLMFGRPRIIEIPRDPEYIDDLVALAREFWGWVESGKRPPVDGSENARRVLSTLHPQNDGVLLDATPEVETLVRQYAAAKAQAKDDEATADTIGNALRALIGDADGFAGDWGRVTWRKSKDSTRTNWPAVAKAYRQVIEDLAPFPSVRDYLALHRIDLDALESIHSESVVGPRVLRLDMKEQAA